MSMQLSLDMATTLPGKYARPLIDTEAIARMSDRHSIPRGGSFYALFSHGGLMTWSGRGKQPAWVKDWITKGGTLDQLKALI